MVTFELDENTPLTDAQREEIARARKMPVVYDEDSPEMTEQMERAFLAARTARKQRAKDNKTQQQ